MNPEEKIKYKSRLAIFYVALGLLMATLLVGLARRQLFESAAYAEQEKIQSHRRILVPGPRGNIFDREGKTLVANRPKMSAVVFLSDAAIRSQFYKEQLSLGRDYHEQGKSYTVNSLLIESRANVVQRYLDDVNLILNRNHQVDPDALTRHYVTSRLLPYPIIDDLTKEEFALLLESLPVESPVQAYVSSMRHYPYSSAAAHALGYVSSSLLEAEEGLPGEGLQTFASKGTFGKNGIEKQYDELLQGKIGHEIWVVDPSGFQVENIQRVYPEKGVDLTLALDVDLHLAAEPLYDKYDLNGALAAIDLDTSEVLALFSKPDYDLNDTSPFMSYKTGEEINEKGAWNNKALSGLYSPGSPFKLITAIAGLKAGICDADTRFNCTGSLIVAGRKFSCYNKNGHGELDLKRAITLSCGSYFYQLGAKVGVDLMSQEANYIGLGTPTNVDLPYETDNMIVPSRAWKRQELSEGWNPGDTTNLSMGQGFIRCTPLQMALMIGSIAKNEVLSHPSMLKQSPEALANRPANKPLGLPENYHQFILEAMESVVQEGTAKFAKVKDVRVGGKTGTAQVWVTGGIIEMAWFVAVAPIENPKIAVALVVEGKKIGGSFGGGTNAAPIAQNLLQTYFDKHPELKSVQPAAP